MATATHIFTGLENDKTYYVRIFPKNHEGVYQSELDGQVVVVIPTEEAD